jgi:DNA-binding IclR family transcriptional regulator
MAEVADAPLLMRILDAYQILSISLAQGLLRPPEETLPEHLEILDAIDAGDPDRAERTMVHHIRSSMRYLKLRSGDGGGSALAERLRPLVKAPLVALVAATKETAVVACRERQEAVVIAAREPARMLRIACRSETRFPLHASAAGRVLLASSSARKAARSILDGELVGFTPHSVVDADELQALLEKTRREGYAMEEEEFEAGVCGLAVPIEERGETIGAVSLLVPVARFASRREDLLRELRAAAAEITNKISAKAPVS